MCRCIQEKEQYIKENLSKGNPKFANVDVQKVHVKHQLEILFSALNIPVTVEGTKVNKKGETVKVKKELYYAAQYCPFCGEKWIV